MLEKTERTEQHNEAELHAEETVTETPDIVHDEENKADEQQVNALAEALSRIQELETRLEESDKKEQDLLLRNRAEVDNIRRRAEQDVEKAHKFALEKFSKDLLETIDNLERALAMPITIDNEGIKGVIDGIELTLKGLLATVSRFGVEAVGVVGDAFNPDLHQAISMQPTEGFEKNQITTVLQKGYLLNGRVIRPAMVMVAA